ncbi:HD domain-containing protein [Candidatus Tisiphia endosymbiont of Psammoecus bipunctatus]|uniref:HD domain-containing protein n=1 Tax=Candidatus Tisiphia endosymbiont of Psammoecus bipunctatus TaxID=3139333 RepID=UPI0035C92768
MEDINYWDNSRYQSCAYAERLLNELILLNEKVKQPIDMYEVKKGIYYAKKYHGSQMRQSGEPYYSHPIEVAYMVAQYTALEIPRLFRTDIIVTALLHDTIEDTPLTEKMIAYIFGSQVASQVQDLTRVKPHGKISSAETLDLLIQQKKHDVALIKLFDRIHNLETVGVKSPEKIKKIIEETVIHFVTLAIHLEIPTITKQIIELCCQHLSIKHPLLKQWKIMVKDDFQFPETTSQNEVAQIYNQYLLGS